MKSIVKGVLRYSPLSETETVRNTIQSVAGPDLPTVPADEADLIHVLIRRNNYKMCLETGFHTGSTAIVMASAVEDRDGTVISVSVDDDKTVERGLDLISRANLSDRHQLIRENSNRAISELFLSGETLDFVFIDGWKTFDHLAYEMYMLNQMLRTGGAIVFDDAYLPSVRKVISLLKSHYEYTEINYSEYGIRWRTRLYYGLTRLSFNRPYRALIKAADTENQKPFQDWTFYRPF